MNAKRTLTQLAAWTQSVTRRRWYATKTGVLAFCLALTGLLGGVLLSPESAGLRFATVPLGR